MTAREYLSEIEKLRVRIGLLKAELAAAYESLNLLPGVSYDGVKVQTTTDDSRTLEIIERCVDKQRKLVALIDRYEAERSERVELIHRLDNERHITVLYERYVRGRYMYQIARKIKGPDGKMGVGLTTVKRLHAEALARLEVLL